MAKSETDARNQIAREFPAACGACASEASTATSSKPEQPEPCLTNDAGGSTCGSRIQWVRDNMAKSETDARNQIAREFPAACGACASEASTGASTGTSHQAGCGFACNHNKCDEINKALGREFSFYEYGGSCSMNLFAADGFGTDLQDCTHDFFLWDEPFTQSHRGKPQWGSMSYVVKQWKHFTSLPGMSDRIRLKRAAGMKVTTPLFTGGDTVKSLEEFFKLCGSGCNDPTSPEYIDVIAWNAWIGAWSNDYQGQVNWIGQMSDRMKQAFGDRPVWLSNYGFLGPEGTPANQVKALTQYDIFDKVDRVYYFSAIDVGGGTADDSNSLHSNTIRDAFLSQCKH